MSTDLLSPAAEIEGTPDGTGRRQWLIDAAVVTAVTITTALVALLFNSRFYYFDDTQSGSTGIWYRFGSRLLSGEFSFLDLSTWGSGNILVEGQWGVFNPLMVAIALGSRFVENFALYATGVKVFVLVVGALGGYTLMRAVRAGRTISILIACLIPLTGFTVYMDASSWVTGLICWALFPWLWVSVIKVQRGAWGYFPAGGFLFLIVSVGYFHGTLMALLLLTADVLGSAIRRRWSEALPPLVLAVVGVLFMILVYAPSILSSPVTLRSGTSIASSGFLGPDLSDLATLTAIAGGSELPTWSDRVVAVPLFYAGWAVPLVLLGVTSRLRSRRFEWTPAIMLVFSAALLLGPTDVGPLRFPVRVLPYVMLAALVVIAQNARDSQWSVLRSRPWPNLLASLLTLPVLAFWLTWSDSPASLRAQFVGLLAVAAALLILAALARRGTRAKGLLSAALLATMLLTVLTRFIAPSSFLPDFGMPAERDRLQSQLRDVSGPVFVVGNTEGAEIPGLWEESLMARLWQVNPAEVQNSYVVIGYANYVGDLGLNYLGQTPAQTLDTLFSEDPKTGQNVVDLLGIDNVQLWRNTFGDRDLNQPPPGWRVAQDGRYTVLWSRDAPRYLTGAVTYASPGVEYVMEGNLEDEAVVRVTNPGTDPGTLVFARLAWPGYRADGAELADPARGYLLSVQVPGGVSDHAVTVRYQPPGLRIGLMAGGAALLILAGAEILRRRSKRKRGSDPMRRAPNIAPADSG